MEEERQEDHTETFQDVSDFCQQLMDRYANSSAAQHRHLLAAAAAMRSMLVAESFPLTPPAYFAAAISAVETASCAQTLDCTSVASLLSFMSIVLTLVPKGGINPEKAHEAVGVMVEVVGRGGEKLAVSSARAGVKCMGILLEFCDLEDWNSLKLGFESLLKFSIDKRPKVRRCAQECLEQVFKSLQHSKAVKESSKLVLSLLNHYMPLATNLITSRALDGSKGDISSKHENLEALHVLTVVKLSAPYLYRKVISEVFSEICKLLSPEFSVLTRDILKTMFALFVASNVKYIVSDVDNVMPSLAAYVSLGNKNPLDTTMSAVTLLQEALHILAEGRPASCIRNLPIVCRSILGLLTYDTTTASQASGILKNLLDHHLDRLNLTTLEFQQSDGNQHSQEEKAIKSTCDIFEDALNATEGIPNKYMLDVISCLFIRVGKISHVLLKNIVLKLACMMTKSYGTIDTMNLQQCIGSAVIAMGPEKFLLLVSISLDDQKLSCSNVWLIPILKEHVCGASLAYYMEQIIPLAKSFKRASKKAKNSAVRQQLLVHAYDLLGLLPSFCRYAVDTCEKFGTLESILITFLKKEPCLRNSVFDAIQVLVNVNRNALQSKKDADEIHSPMTKGSLLKFERQPTYTKNNATRNLKALASSSNNLLQALVELFTDSPSERGSPLKDTIGCLASIVDPSVTKTNFLSILEKFQFINPDCQIEKPFSNGKVLLDMKNVNDDNPERDSSRCVILELASSFVQGADDNLVDLIYSLIQLFCQTSNESIHSEVYYTLSRILEDHLGFCSSRFAELLDLLLGLKPPVDLSALRNRFACFHTLMVHSIKINQGEEDNTKAFLILNEIIVTSKNGKDEARKAAYDVLLKISSSLRDSSCDSCESYRKLISMIMGYLSSSSPQIKSGAISALSLLVYNDADICLLVPDLVASLLALLQTKALEVIKAVLGFVKVMVSSLQAKDLQTLLPAIITEVLPWSSVSRNHFRSKVTVIFEIIIRKCGPAAIKATTPEKYKNFLNFVLENRHKKENIKDASNTDAKDVLPASSAKRPVEMKSFDSKLPKIESSKHKRKREKFGSLLDSHSGEKKFTKLKNNFDAKLPMNQPAAGIGTARKATKNLLSAKNKSTMSKGRTLSKRNRYEGPTSGEKRESKTKLANARRKGAATFHETAAAQKSHKNSKLVTKRQRVGA